MAKLKPIVLNKIGKEKLTNVKIRLTHDHKAVDIRTPYYIPYDVMGRDGIIKEDYPSSNSLNKALNIILVDYNRIIAGIDNIEQLDIKTIANRLKNSTGGGESFTQHADKRIKWLKKEGRISTAENYASMISNLKTCSGKDDLQFKEINLDLINKFQLYLKDRVSLNTIRIYLSNIRAICFHAVDNDVIKMDFGFFRKVKINVPQAEKRSLTPEILAELTKIDDWAVHLYLLSFYLCGINFKDLLLAKPQTDRLEFLRYKTKAKKPVKISIKIVKKALYIINRYKGEKYLLRFMDVRKPDRYRGVVKQVNNRLKKLSDLKFTTYSARHSFATIAYQLGIPESTISEMLGHSSGLAVTNRYIKRDYTKQDQAQLKVINHVHRCLQHPDKSKKRSAKS